LRQCWHRSGSRSRPCGASATSYLTRTGRRT
jgi:hypothetical protein